MLPKCFFKRFSAFKICLHNNCVVCQESHSSTSMQAFISIFYSCPGRVLLRMNLGSDRNLEKTNLMHLKKLHVAGDNLCVLLKAKRYCPGLGHLS